MKSLFGAAAVAIIMLGVAVLPSKTDMARFAQTQAESQVAAKILAENMHHMQ